MDAASFLAGLLLVHLGAVATPGPNTLLVANLAAGGSRRIALWAATGTAAAAVIWIGASLGGASALFVAAPGLARWLRWAGGLYLLYLGALALRSALARHDGGGRSGFVPRSGGAAFRIGLLTNLGNPKSLAYYLSLLVATAAPSAPAWQKIAGGAGMAMISLGWYGLLAWTCSAPPVRRFYTRLRPFIAGVTGLIMIVFGGALLMVF